MHSSILFEEYCNDATAVKQTQIQLTT